MNSRKDKKRLRVSKRILRAARKIVIENGFDRVSLRAIARRIDYSPAALYEYYPGGIEEILDAVCEDIEGEMATALSKALENSAAHSVLVDLGMAYIQFALSHRDDFRLLYLRPLSPRARQVVEIFQHQLSKAAGLHAVFPSFDFEEDEMAHAMWATAHGLVMLSLTRDAYVNDLGVHREILDRMVIGLRG